jgi:transcriptional regulator of acetoin/glycerol metabolism
VVLMIDSDRLSKSDLPAQISIGRQDRQLALAQTPKSGDQDSGRGKNAELPSHELLFDSSHSEDAEFLLDNVIKKTLIRSLEQTQGNRRRAAVLLGVSRSTLYRMLARYGLCDKPEDCDALSELRRTTGPARLHQ